MLTFSIPKFSMQVVLLCVVVFSLLENSSCASSKSYIVYLGSHLHGPRVTTTQLDAVRDSHHAFLGFFLGSKERAREAIFYSYERHINGFAATLDEHDVANIKNHPNVVSVFKNKPRKLHTTHSWEFLRQEENGFTLYNSLWNKARYGEDIIIANLDSGVSPESKSFSDDEGYGPIPSKWKGQCQPDVGIPCNKKLIGARYYNKGFIAEGGKINASMNNARDYVGHGSHTLSIAGGNFVQGAQVFGALNGTAKGGAPRARLAIYKVCWPDCFDADILKAIDVAIGDRVDVLSISLGDPPSKYFDDMLSIGSFHAIKEGIAVVCAAGNEGSFPHTVTNISPWILTVGATTLDRTIVTFLLLRNGKRLQGSSITKALPEDRFYPLITAKQAKASNATNKDATECMSGTLDPAKVKGKILVCVRGGQISSKGKGREALHAGAVGMILYNVAGKYTDVPSDYHVLPAVHLNYTDGLAVFDYINSTSNPTGFITASRSQYGTIRAPLMASFSSRGPNKITPEILKPDITAPGVDIIAAYSSEAREAQYDKRITPYAMLQGTSMSCPHVAGVVALLKSLHPNWTSAAIKSAIMTTATTRDNQMRPIIEAEGLYTDGGAKATPFGYGAGHIRPNRAADPGLLYDLTINDYLDFLCALGYSNTLITQFSGVPNYKCPSDAEAKANGTTSSTLLLNFNYPSISVPNIKAGSSVRIMRRLKNVTGPGKYYVRLIQPRGFVASVEPTCLTFNEFEEEKTYELTLKAINGNKSSDPAAKKNKYSFGELIWSDGVHYVSSPIVVSVA